MDQRKSIDCAEAFVHRPCTDKGITPAMPKCLASAGCPGKTDTPL